ncbi:hypothetical protein BU15DRAFT_49361 [Melanogaster broomeanus]|nr:hypothetical protein BU15DRAFT_49361 [Melanogaster broomeanus]
MQRCTELISDSYLKEIRHAASEDGGWHFGASTATTQQLEDFNLDDMGRDLEAHAPGLWSFVGLLLQGDEKQKGGSGGGNLGTEKDVDGDVVMDEQSMDMEGDYWNAVDEVDLEGFIEGLTAEGGLSIHAKDRRKKRRAAIKTIKKIVIISIIMQSINRKSNALQSTVPFQSIRHILGLFLQSAHTPQKVIDTLARVGISISTDAINAAVHSLSIESQTSLRKLGQSLLATYAYDNFDVDLKSHVPIAEKSNDSLKHLTSGLLFPLMHGITADDLKCSQVLWEKSALNPQLDYYTRTILPDVNYYYY